jgi:hypothetical protein
MHLYHDHIMFNLESIFIIDPIITNTFKVIQGKL